MVFILFSISILSACNTGNNEPVEQEEEVNDQPVRYEPNPNQNDPDQGNRPFIHDENPNQTDQQMEKGNDRQFDKDRGAE